MCVRERNNDQLSQQFVSRIGINYSSENNLYPWSILICMNFACIYFIWEFYFFNTSWDRKLFTTKK